MYNQPMQIELQPHNGCFGRNDNSVPAFDGAILDCEPFGIDPRFPPLGRIVETRDGRHFSYAYTVAFPSNGFYVFREVVHPTKQ